MSKKSRDEPAGDSAPAKPQTSKSEPQMQTPPPDEHPRERAGNGESVGGEQRNGGPRRADAGAGQPRRGAAGLISAVALVLALAAAGFSAWQTYESRQQRAELELQLARKLAEIETIGSDSRRLSGNARDIARDVEARLGQLEARVADLQNQRLALESLYEELSQTRDQWTLAEVEQILLIASQQLQLAGNVKAALIALEAADARLARSDRPQLTELRRVIQEDIERLKATPFVDVTGIGLKLERLVDGIDQMPLAFEVRPVTVDSEADNVASTSTGWRRVLAEFWNDLLGLVRVERVDSPQPPLLAPEQTFFLKENLKLRLLSARLALLARDQAAYRADLSSAQEWLKRYFDDDASSVASAIETLDQLGQSDIRIELPDVSASLDAVRAYRLTRERAVR